jgi:hypothetical protein
VIHRSWRRPATSLQLASRGGGGREPISPPDDILGRMRRPHHPTRAPLPLTDKVALAADVWMTYARVRRMVRRHPLPEVIDRLTRQIDRRDIPVDAKRLGRIVHKVTRVGPWSPRCLYTALVLYRLLLERGDTPELVIGLPRSPRTKTAHAWVELDGVDVGPPPGSRGHAALARYGSGVPPTTSGGRAERAPAPQARRGTPRSLPRGSAGSPPADP